MYTYGYIKEATMAHLAIDETEAQAMKLQERYHIFANEAMQAICASKPKYEYFKCQGVREYARLINLGDNEFRLATEEEINWQLHGLPEPNFADETDTIIWHNERNIYLLNEAIKMPDNFISFAEKEAYVVETNSAFDSEVFVMGLDTTTQEHTKRRATKNDYIYSGNNTIVLYEEVEYFIPYKGFWYRFKSGIDDYQQIDMPVDIFLTIPLYVASICLEEDNQQKAAVKRAQFERALANCTPTDFLDLKSITSSY